jgi:hypothetical protein
MASVTYVIDTNLTPNAQGVINQYAIGTMQAAQTQIQLYLNISKNSIPFNNFGNIFVQKLFETVDADIQNELIKFVITDISNILANSGIGLSSYKIDIDKDNAKVNLELNLSNGQTMKV